MFDTLQKSLIGKCDGGEPIITKDLQVRIKDVALDAEDEVESLMKQLIIDLDEDDECCRAKLDKVSQQVIQATDSVNEELIIKQKINNCPEADENNVSPLLDDSIRENVMEGYNKERENMVERLTKSSGANKLQVVSVVGMAGIGKTTFTKTILFDNYIKRVFRIRVWITVSNNYDLRKLLLVLLRDVIRMRDGNDNTMDIGKLAERVQQGLKGEKYLIVVDDIWSNQDWDRISHWFPDCGNRSRILLTSRDNKVGEYVATNPKDGLVLLRPLTQDESRCLFYYKAFGKNYSIRGSDIDEFEKVGEEVVTNCKGLSLMITAVAGILSSKSKLDEWIKVAKSVSSLVNDDDYQQCLKVVALSYNHLPSLMKACFLHFRVFPKAHVISVKKLIRLWIAEGLVNLNGVEEFEQVATRVLHDLIGKSLVIVDKRSLNGKIKTCRIHDLFHDFCSKEAESENLLYVVGSDSTTISQVHTSFHQGISLSSPGDKVLGNLQSVSGLSPSCCTKEIFEGIKKVKKLAIRGRKEEYPTDLEWIENLKYLQDLESLSIAIQYWYIINSTRFFSLTSPDSFPQKLKKLKLSRTCLPWEYMSIISKLPVLEVLQLKRYAFRGHEWKATDQIGFQKLRFLLLENLMLDKWTITTISHDHFPSLERVLITDCIYLKEIPQGFADSKKLELIELHRCDPSLVAFAEKIQEKHEDLGRNKLKVTAFNSEVGREKLSYREMVAWGVDLASSATGPTEEDIEVVGFDRPAKDVIKRLCEGSKDLDVIPIVGMPGLGKTTLSKKVYHDSYLEFHFYKRMWIYVGTSKKPKDILVEIVKEVVPSNSEELIKDKDEDQLAHIIREFLVERGFDIPAWKLIRLWVAEGLIKSDLQGSEIEEVAETYLSDFAGRNLVMVMQKRSNGQIKTCLLHDMLHEFCIIEAKRISLFQQVYLQPGVQVFPSIDDPNTSRRLCIQSSTPYNFIPKDRIVQHVRSLLCFSSNQKQIDLSNQDIQLIPYAFALIRVLDIQSLIFEFSEMFYRLFHLRYIAIKGNFTVLPSLFGNFWYLQTLILHTDTASSTLEIKEDRWKMLQLRHLHSNLPVKLPLSPTSTSKSCTSCLQTLSKVTPDSCKKSVLAKVCHLRKLGIEGQLAILLGKSTKGHGFDSFQELRCVENLKLLNNGWSEELHLPAQFFSLQKTLNKLTLSNTSFEWSEADILGKLECLKVLKLKDNAFIGKNWKPKKESFSNLQVLQIVWADNWETWDASNLPFKSLTHLVLISCYDLKAVPHELADLPYLQEMKMMRTFKAVSSAIEIKSKKLGKQNPESSIKFNLIILPPALSAN
ncbi:hypothetical protein MTR67_017158 [Solanum verrucosum]|uniref:NB-ARC domain-containing protein n=1 Tax=Solanum verrucosum TaxID=315347 RepID=A0AAF0QII2_SOLVR|nr:hypothetical protein MTR67_017158 [Solanum verrucosum]